MATFEIVLKSNQVNSSMQIGDTAYACSVDSDGIVSNQPAAIGLITNIVGSTISVDDSLGGTPSTDDFFFFSKAIEANESSLKGYYADVTFKNESKKYAELFAISSEVSPSSK